MKKGVRFSSIESMSRSLYSICSYENIISLLPNFKKYKHNFNSTDLNSLRLDLLNRNVFFVKDLKIFIELVRKNIDVDVNAGIQKWRGRNNSVHGFLSYLDQDFIHNIFNIINII